MEWMSITTGFPFSPTPLIAEPKRKANTINGSKFDLEKITEKSGALKMRTIASLKVIAFASITGKLFIIPLTSTPCRGFKIRAPKYPITQTMTIIQKNTIKEEVVIFFIRLRSSDFVIAERILKKTKGTKITNIKFKKISPKGFKKFAIVG